MTAQDPTPAPEGTVAILVQEDHLGTMEGVEFIRQTKLQLEALGYKVVFRDEKEWMAQSRVLDCDCQLLQCVCVEARKHKLGCQWRLAMTCPVAFSCEAHGRDVCEECDPCSCERDFYHYLADQEDARARKGNL